MVKEFSLTYELKETLALTRKLDKKVLAEWALFCSKRVLPYFEKECPNDKRPRHALETLQEWIKTGQAKLKDIRKASLNAHAAARKTHDLVAKSAARSCAQAIATAHAKLHSIATANYALQTIYYKTSSMKKVKTERRIQLNKLKELVLKYC